MMDRRHAPRAWAAVALAFGLASSGCARAPAGMASFAFASTKILSTTDGVEVVGRVEKQMCAHNAVLLVHWGEQGSHEAIIQSELERLGADALTNAELTYTQIPALLYNRACAKVVGDAVRFRRSPS